MGKVNYQLLAFNRGIISKLGLARIDVEKVKLSAEEQTNWLPRLLGSMMLRPGLGFIGSTLSNLKAKFFSFIFSRSQTALFEFTEENLRIWVDDELVTRPSSVAYVSNGNFSFPLGTEWVDVDQSGGDSGREANPLSIGSDNYLYLTGDGVNYGVRRQEIFVTANSPLAFRVDIYWGPVEFKISSSSTFLDDSDLLFQGSLGTGSHSILVTPTTGTIYIYFFSNLKRKVYVSEIQVESAGVLTLPTPYQEEDLKFIRKDQSLDVVYLACRGYQPRKIERRGDGNSWSFVVYEPEDGPVKIQNTTATDISASAISGRITLTAESPIFSPSTTSGDQAVGGSVNQIYKIVSQGQNVLENISSDNVFTNPITIDGTGTQRSFVVNITGTFSATVTLQRSLDEVNWADINNFTTATTTTITDGLDNQIVFYRIGIKSGNYTSGTATCSLAYSAGSITGYVRIRSVASTGLTATADVLKDLGSTNGTNLWSAGEWSDALGYPSAVALSEGRLFFAGLSKIWGSIIDAFESFDDDIEGDSGLISRDLGGGAVSNVNWLSSLYRLFVGTDSSLKMVKTDSFEEPITPNNFRLINVSSQSCSDVALEAVDKNGVFVQGSKTRVYELQYNGTDYQAQELTKIAPEIGNPEIIACGIQRVPDTINHFVRSDGKVALLIYDALENLAGWFIYETDGLIEDVVILPGDLEDQVYYVVNRTINGSTVRYLEKFAFQYECQGDTLNKQADSFITYEGSPTTIITGLDHLEGERVIVWADGRDLSPTTAGVQTTYLVSGGSITLSEEVSNAVIGLPYNSFYKSSKLAQAAASPLGQRKKVNAIGVILNNTHAKGLKYGKSATSLDNLPEINPVTGKRLDYDTLLTEIDTPMFSFNGEWNTDSRLCLAAYAPRPCTLLACELAITTNEKE